MSSDTAEPAPVPSSGPFSGPFVQLLRCHRRLEEACEALGRAVTERDVETVNDVASFLGRQIRRHEEDEDGSLFPRLAAIAELRPVLARLEDEHRAHGRLHARLEDALSGRLEAGVDQWVELGVVADALVRSYRKHIEDEETLVFPAARDRLSEAEIDAMQAEIDERRGRGPGAPTGGASR